MVQKDSKKLKVLMVTTSFPVGPNRASGIFVKRLADSMSAQIDLTVLTPSAVDLLEARFDYQVKCFRYAPYKWQILAHQPGGIVVALKSHPWLVLLLPVFLLALFFSVIIHGKKVDVIHANWSSTGFIAGIAAKIIGKPVITTLRGSDVRSIEESALSRFIMEQTFRFSRLIVTVSETIAQDLSRLWSDQREKLCAIANGVSDDLLSIQHRSKNDSLIVSTIGSLIPRKDIATIIRAFQMIEGDVQLRIIGEGIERTALESVSQQLEVSNRVVFVGALPPEAISEELAITDIFVLSSYFEGRPNVVLEAMAAGCAIVTTDLPGVRELLEKDINGLFFQPGDAEALAKHLKSLLSSEKRRRQLGREARSRIIEMGLTWSNCGARYISLYQRVLEQN